MLQVRGGPQWSDWRCQGRRPDVGLEDEIFFNIPPYLYELVSQPPGTRLWNV